MTAIRRVLVANRGEIARRIFRTCRHLGIGTVAVYADPDREAPHVREADVAIALGGLAAAETYLAVDRLIQAARRAGADAVHPGYGFLAERADFARAVIDAGLTWVGPSPEAIAAMGDKLAARALAARAGVPTLPASAIDGPAPAAVARAGDAVGFPVLVKAAGGGGGRGMRIVRDPQQLADAVVSARREAAAAFGDDRVFLERYLDSPRHIEVQILGDRHGRLIHLLERECSIQRRHQKIVEEAPSPAVGADLRARLTAAALAMGRAIAYAGAGTVEFIVDAAGAFYFLEVNTRLQVEHPVTEAITGIDLVREQLRVAGGAPLDLAQADVRARGHAIEARLYAEDPANGFLPTGGRVLDWEAPAGVDVRIDSAVEADTEVPVAFDPMIAKLVAHAPTRDEAARRLAAALERLVVAGLVTNRDFLVNVLRHPAFLAGDTTTDFIERHRPAPGRVPDARERAEAALAAALAAQAARRAGARVLRAVPSGWRNNPSALQEVRYRGGGGEITVGYRALRDGTFTCVLDGAPARARLVATGAGGRGREEAPPGGQTPGAAPMTEPGARGPIAVDGRAAPGAEIALEIDGVRRTYRITPGPAGAVFVQDARGEIRLDEVPRFPDAGPGTSGPTGGHTAPMPGRVVEVRVTTGDAVQRDQLLLTVEAMKMEHEIRAAGDGIVAAVRVSPGQQVDAGTLLVVIEPAPSGADGPPPDV